MADDLDLDLDALERIARAASKGPWKVGDREPYVEVWGRMQMNASPILASLECEPRKANAAHIAAANPDAVPALIARVRAAEERAEKAEQALSIANRGGLDLLYAIRKAMGLNEYTSLDILAGHLSETYRTLRTWDTPTHMSLLDLAKARMRRLDEVEDALRTATADKLSLLEMLDDAPSKCCRGLAPKSECRCALDDRPGGFDGPTGAD